MKNSSWYIVPDIENTDSRWRFLPVKLVTPNYCYFGASNKVMWKVFRIITVITDWTVRYFNIMQILITYRLPHEERFVYVNEEQLC